MIHDLMGVRWSLFTGNVVCRFEFAFKRSAVHSTDSVEFFTGNPVSLRCTQPINSRMYLSPQIELVDPIDRVRGAWKIPNHERRNDLVGSL